MTVEQIMKALGYHRTTMENHCDECPYKGRMCSIALSSDALDLINRQKADIERLQKLLDCANGCIEEIEYALDKVGQANSRVDEAIEEYNTLVKEMTEVNDDE